MDEKITPLDIENISGHKKQGQSLLTPLQNKYISRIVPFVPKWLETYHLTLLSLPLSFLILLGGYLSSSNKIWILLCVFGNIGQYLTDYLDGEIGRRRKTGLILWGFLVDHYLDFVFGCCDVIAIGLVLNINPYYSMIALIVVSGSFLLEIHKCNLFGRYDVHGYNGIGGIELKFATVIYLLFIMFIAKTITLPLYFFSLALSFFSLTKQFIDLQNHIWQIDMKNKDQA